MRLSVVIPAYNEEERLPGTLKRISSFLKQKGWEYEILVVDDGSRDRTREVARAFAKKDRHVRLVQNKRNLGKGATVKNGMLHAGMDWVLFSDADLSTPIEMLDRMVSFTKDYDIIIGSRNAATSRILMKQPRYRVIAGKAFPLIVRLLLLRRLKDTQCGFKLFRKKAVRPLLSRQRLSGWAFDAELLFIAKRLGYRVKEVGIDWKNDAGTKLHFIRDSYRMFRDVLKIRVNDWTGKYR